MFMIHNLNRLPTLSLLNRFDHSDISELYKLNWHANECIFFQVKGRRTSSYSGGSFHKMQQWFRKSSLGKLSTSMKFFKRGGETLTDEDEPGVFHSSQVSDVTGQKVKSGLSGSEEVCYEAHSPDEAALIHTAKAYGFTMVERTPHYVTVKLPNDTLLKFEVLDVLTFDSTRRRMSIIVRHPHTSEIIMYTKGADSAVMERLENVFSGEHQKHEPACTNQRIGVSEAVFISSKIQEYCEILLECKITVVYVNSLQCHMIFRNHNNMLIYCWFLIIINVENSCAAQYFCGNCDTFFFRIHMNMTEKHLFKIEVFVTNVINFFMNWMCTCWINVYISLKKKTVT